jgi:hypothetical protein
VVVGASVVVAAAVVEAAAVVVGVPSSPPQAAASRAVTATVIRLRRIMVRSLRTAGGGLEDQVEGCILKRAMSPVHGRPPL